MNEMKIRKIIEKINEVIPSTIEIIWKKIRVIEIERIDENFGKYQD
ncbi:MAG: hypothetical protein ACTSR3_08070 [Candidatus Helarchaeota archaeon]